MGEVGRSDFVRPGTQPGTVILRCIVPRADGTPCGNEYLQDVTARSYWGACSPACYGRKSRSQRKAGLASVESRREVLKDAVYRDAVMRRGYRQGLRNGKLWAVKALRALAAMAGGE